jgi:LmeA-like phospholipid-binding
VKQLETVSWFFRPDRWPITPADWLRVVDDLARAPTRALLDAFASVADALTGKDLKLRGPKTTVDLHLDSVTGEHSAPPIAMGALRPGLDLEGLEVVDIEASDVRWDRGRMDRLTVRAHNLNLEGGLVTRLVAGPIELAAEVDQDTLRSLLEEREIGVEVDLDADDQVTVRVNRWVSAEVSVELDGDEVRLPVHRVRVAGIPVPFAERFVSPRSVTVPPLPRDLRLTGVSLAPGTIRATGVVDRFQEPIVLEQVLRAATNPRSEAVISLSDPRQVT